MENRIRLSRPGDEEDLKSLWHTVFGDDWRYIETFFDQVYTPGAALVAEAGEAVASMVFLLPIGRLVTPNGSSFPCTVSYAFATQKVYRGRGLGQAIANRAVQRSWKTGFPVNTICPAEDSLFGYYENRVGYEDFFYVQEQEFAHSALLRGGAIPSITGVDAAAYSRIRRSLLAERVYVDFAEKMMRYQQTLCCQSGGGLFLLQGEHYTACAAVELAEGKTAFVKELLVPEEHFQNALSAVAGAVPAKKYLVRTPAKTISSGRRFAMLKAESGFAFSPSYSAPAWYGFAFD